LPQSKISGIKDLWPIHSKPRNDELLSSWLCRLANGHGLSLKSFCAAVLPKRALQGNIDVKADLKLLKLLAKHTGTPFNTAVGTSLSAYEGRLAENIESYWKYS
jgi:hypothetical protein